MSSEAIIRQVEPVTEPANSENHFTTIADSTHTLRESVEIALKNYFDAMDGQPVSELYEMVLAEVEAPLLETVMRYTRDNQTKASIVLGLNRGTLRKKLKQYGML
ncbi:MULTISPECIES: DNA-binding transcriptional regulator Fis [Thalassolituus]|jgi:Fis family transcriptional regulator|uniref:Putative Fis-like DNA-binding protein n=1 Tax=Thalassolituus maritimus TaxID=484498 RepID=A0A1N7LZH6_9GAMM|nr:MULTISPECIES: DNA-binding transcriptional regulator Fis [Thalassolituus]KZY99060.1 Fis family transcriptional regulator [Oleibacter sp. HI0075]MAX87625.1 DNA-binding transcriptional regulator Fis [Oceanospirillaceae bacterium]MEC8908319.1 DNA-binding transcriptional regulator Fis [Pseudomonadota bacterium]KZY99187.1 Fis family transcriptional regulator [Oleibacter sp. HI0075]MBN57675.1 DNA-binding transcriptional regulator Fis [Oceanospirillaceae bacterium]|tara:strand:- start:2940 stop:3254 length:315 start_codon:yes stop_codon:yes gene_type:complete